MFSFYGHPLTQEEIVLATYGDVTCLPASSTTVLGQILSASWIDDYGFPFSSQIVADYDSYNGINDFSNAMVVNALSSNNPLLYANTHHVMVVYSVSYEQTSSGPNIQTVSVVDPWPLSPPFHALTSAEMVPVNLGGELTFLAEVNITSLSKSRALPAKSDRPGH